MDFTDKFIATLVTSAVVLLGTTIMSSKDVRGYYLGSPNERTHGFCISADINWSIDPVVYCSDDITKVLTVYDRLKH